MYRNQKEVVSAHKQPFVLVLISLKENTKS